MRRHDPQVAGDLAGQHAAQQQQQLALAVAVEVLFDPVQAMLVQVGQIDAGRADGHDRARHEVGVEPLDGIDQVGQHGHGGAPEPRVPAGWQDYGI